MSMDFAWEWYDRLKGLGEAALPSTYDDAEAYVVFHLDRSNACIPLQPLSVSQVRHIDATFHTPHWLFANSESFEDEGLLIKTAMKKATSWEWKSPRLSCMAVTGRQFWCLGDAGYFEPTERFKGGGAHWHAGRGVMHPNADKVARIVKAFHGSDYQKPWTPWNGDSSGEKKRDWRSYQRG